VTEAIQGLEDEVQSVDIISMNGASTRARALVSRRVPEISRASASAVL
jgi:hypothetical protein